MKIIEAINSMIANSNKINSVFKKNDEYFFNYNNKYNWSITFKEGNYTLFLYPEKNTTLDELIAREDFEWSEYSDYVTYKSENIKTREAIESFSELFQLVSSKVFGIDDILNDIIKDDPF